MAFVEINSAYREILDSRGLTEADAFLAMRGTIISGHHNRHVVRLTLGSGSDAIVAFLKKEHRVPWKERLASAWAGFGFISQSCREARILRIAEESGIGAPELLAAGEDDNGRAFVLVREIHHGIDVRHFLRRCRRSPRRRRRLMRVLGKALARLHQHGLRHPDLYAKHVLVDPRTMEISFLDWQRSRRVVHVSLREGGRDLAALFATLPDESVSAKDRRAALRAYCNRFANLSAPRIRERLSAIIHRQIGVLLRRRRIRELREAPTRQRVKGVVWKDGEALCMMEAWHASLGGRVPAVLRWNRRGAGLANLTVLAPFGLPGGRSGRLVRRWRNSFWSWLWDRLRCKRTAAPEIAKAGLLYRLQRFGVATPRLLAFGQHSLRPWQTDAFLLVERRPSAVPLHDWLRNQSKLMSSSTEQTTRRRVIETVARMLRRIHSAGCRLGSTKSGARDAHLCIWPRADGRFAIGVDDIDDLHSDDAIAPIAMRRDFRLLQGPGPTFAWSRADAIRFFLAYMKLKRLTPAAKRVAREFIRAITTDSEPFAGARTTSDG